MVNKEAFFPHIPEWCLGLIMKKKPPAYSRMVFGNEKNAPKRLFYQREKKELVLQVKKWFFGEKVWKIVKNVTKRPKITQNFVFFWGARGQSEKPQENLKIKTSRKISKNSKQKKLKFLFNFLLLIIEAALPLRTSILVQTMCKGTCTNLLVSQKVVRSLCEVSVIFSKNYDFLITQYETWKKFCISKNFFQISTRSKPKSPPNDRFIALGKFLGRRKANRSFFHGRWMAKKSSILGTPLSKFRYHPTRSQRTLRQST